MRLTLSVSEARKAALHSQRIYTPFEGSEKGTLEAIQHLGYIQIDSIFVIERAHHHTLWNRIPNYHAGFLNELVRKRKVFEYWSHAAAYLPISDYRFYRRRMKEIAEDTGHWKNRDEKLIQYVLARIKNEGPLQAVDFKSRSNPSGGWWNWKPAKIALEQLFFEGRLMVTCRNNFQKVYDLTERVLPLDSDVEIPDLEEYLQFLIKRYLISHGIGKMEEMAYQRNIINSKMKKVLTEMREAKKIVPITINGERHYCLPESLSLLEKPIPRNKIKILSPFDNIVIQRKRLKTLFNFSYNIECYLPASKRIFGYFCLPILWNRKFIGRMDAKASRNDKKFIVHNLVLESSLRKTDSFLKSFCTELKEFARFNACEIIEVQQVSDNRLVEPLNKIMQAA